MDATYPSARILNVTMPRRRFELESLHISGLETPETPNQVWRLEAAFLDKPFIVTARTYASVGLGARKTRGFLLALIRLVFMIFSTLHRLNAPPPFAPFGR
jgi:hypothetical protein